MAASTVLRRLLATILTALLMAGPAPLLAADSSQGGRPPPGTPNCGGVNDQPDRVEGARSFVYRTGSGRDLRIHIFEPTAGVGERPAILFFFGGGWRRGTIVQFAEQAKAFQARGFVAALADYRVFCRDSSTPMDATEDAQAAYAWLRARTSEFGIDPRRIALAGGSSGGQLAMATAMLAGSDARPGALVLFNPAADLTPPPIRDAIGISDAEARQISPSVLPVEGLPPTILFHGVNDQIAPINHSRAFCDRAGAAGVSCTLREYPGQPHGFFNSRTPIPSLGRSPYEDTVASAMAFLSGLGWP